MKETFPDSLSPLTPAQPLFSNPTQQVELSHTHTHSLSPLSFALSLPFHLALQDLETTSLQRCMFMLLQGAVNVRELGDGGSPIAVATGYLKQYKSMVQVRQQVTPYYV